MQMIRKGFSAPGVKVLLVVVGAWSVFAEASAQNDVVKDAPTMPSPKKSSELGHPNGRVPIVMENGVVIQATPVDGVVIDIGGDVAPDSYHVFRGGVLGISGGAIVDTVSVADSKVSIDGSTVRAGLIVRHNSVADIKNSEIRNVGTFGLSVGGVVEPSVANRVNVSGSTVSGFDAAIIAGSLSVVNLSATDVFAFTNASGVANGIRLSTGTMVLENGSYVESEKIGIRILDGGAGVLLPGVIGQNRLTVDNSKINALSGAAILVDTGTVDTNITIQNNSTLQSNINTLLDVTGTAPVSFRVDNSTLNGNLQANEDSNLNITLQNHAQLTGNIVNSKTLAINSGAHWQMVGDGAVNALAMDGGQVSFAEQGFHQLSLKGLSGSGVFDMRVNLDEGQGDLINVEGRATGEFDLRVQNTGVEGVSPDMQPVRVVHTEGGDARFNLLGGRVDLGAYSYLLEQQGHDWFIVGDGKTVSPSARSALALFNAAPTIWMSELSTLRSRMGEVRGTEQGGGWIRAYGNRFNATTSDGIDYRQQQSGLSFGADAPVPVASGQLLLGLMGGYSKSDLDLSRGTAGTVNSYYVGAYGTWLSEDGYYLDGVLKLNRFRNESDVAMSDASKSKGDYDNSAVGGSVEFGRHIKLGDDYFLEPFAQLATVVVQGDSYRMDNGLQAKNNRTQSTLGKVGSTLGKSVQLKDGGLSQPYVRVALAQEFSRRNEVKINGTGFDNNLFGSRAEVGAGVAVSLSERLQLHADFDYMKGKDVEQPWGANLGLRLAF
jgi:outer membrane autotransporter protein